MVVRKSKFVRNRRPKRTQERAFFAAQAVVTKWPDIAPPLTSPSVWVAGVDEVGRGAWAGPVVAAAVILSQRCTTKWIRDSKLLTAAEREGLARRLTEGALSIGIGEASVEEINRYGLTWAVRQAGLRALATGSIAPDHVLLDGHHNYLQGLRSAQSIIGGDRTELCIAAASIIAKVHRDLVMRQLDNRVPGYGFAVHKGYGVPAHQQALGRLGPSSHHRQHYAPIAALLQAAI